jgi:hypothetical protein
MKHEVLGAALVPVGFVAVFGLACSSTPPAANSFTDVYTQVIAPSCVNDYCHYANVGARYSALDMSNPVIAYWSLVDQPAAGASCSEMGTRVIPGDPQDSIFYLKISESMPPCGAQMPSSVTALEQGNSTFTGPALPADEQQLIYNWILEGAPNN